MLPTVPAPFPVDSAALDRVSFCLGFPMGWDCLWGSLPGPCIDCSNVTVRESVLSTMSLPVGLAALGGLGFCLGFFTGWDSLWGSSWFKQSIPNLLL